MWHWDQGRLEYFQFNNLREIAKYAVHYDFQSASREHLRQMIDLPFSAPNTHDPWRNYSRVLKLALLVKDSDGRAEPTRVAQALARPGAVTCDEYMHFLACTFTEPSPALRDWQAHAVFRYPLLFTLKYLLTKMRFGANSTSAELAEIVGAYASSGFGGNEDEQQFADIVMPDADYAAIVKNMDIRQARESLRVIAQLSYLHYKGQRLSISLTPNDAETLFKQLRPVDGVRAGAPNDEIDRLAQLFDNDDVRSAMGFAQVSTHDLAESGFREGNKFTRTHITIERNAALRRAFFNERRTAVCDVCTMDTALSYPWTTGVIDIHHLLPLSSGTRVTGHGTTLDDLVPVCPSCHRAVHRYYDNWLKRNHRRDFEGVDDARAAYDGAKAAYPGFVSHA